MENEILKLQKYIKDNIDKCVYLAKKASKYNEKGESLLSKDDEWRR